MGMSLDADIMYGMVLRDGEGENLVDVPWTKDDDEDGDEDFEEWMAQQLGLQPLDYSTYPQVDRSLPYEKRFAKGRELQEEWRKANNADAYYKKRRELIATVPVEIDGGGTEDYHTIILRLKASPKINAYYGAKEFDPGTLGFTNEEQQHSMDARDFLARYGVEWAPKWLLVPSYG